MRGNLSDKSFASIIRDLSRENATGRLRLTQNGKIREILIESGVPVFASSTIPDEQPEQRLVQEGIITAEQLRAAVLTSKQASQPIEKILVQTKTVTRLALQRILCELSTDIINSSSEWLTGDFMFAAGPKLPLEAKLLWTSAECILSGARHASGNTQALDSIAPDARMVRQAVNPGDGIEGSACLSSTEGYVLSCIQSPTTIAETSMLTGLSHIDTRRAIFVLIILGLLEGESIAVSDQTPDDRPSPIMSPPASTAGAPERPQYAFNLDQAGASVAPRDHPAPVSGSPPLSLPSQPQANKNGEGCGAAWQSEASPLEFESNAYDDLQDDVSNIAFNSDDTSFIQQPAGILATQRPNHIAQGPSKPPVNISGNGDQKSARHEAADAPRVPFQGSIPDREAAGSIFIPGAGPSPVQEAGPPDSVPGMPHAATGRSEPASPTSDPVGSRPEPFRANTGSIYIPGVSIPPGQDTGYSPTNQSAFAGQARPQQQHSTGDTIDGLGTAARQNVLPASQAPEHSSPGAGWNGENDPRLHQEWRDQLQQAVHHENGEDERFLKRVIDELGAKIRLAASADYYQILGVDKLASNGSITKAYERIARINDNHKSRWPYNAELQAQISSLMVIVEKAYETLGNPEKRRLYDMPPKQADSMELERGTGVPSWSASLKANAWPSATRHAPVQPPIEGPGQASCGGQAAPVTEHHNPYQAAEELYRRGRSCFARSDLQGAAHLLRQAVKLDPNRSSYHYQLGMTLFILSQARAEHKHDKGCHVTCKMGGNLTRNQRIRHEAEQHLLKASELEPSNSDIKLKLALLYKDANMDRKAHQYFYEALMLDPNCHIARVELGMEDTRKNDEDQWIKDLMNQRLKKK